MQAPTKRIVLLGATGSIGTQTIEVVEHLNALHSREGWPVSLRVVGIAASRDSERLRQALARTGASAVALTHGEPGGTWPDWSARERHLLCGPDAPRQLIREIECDLVVAAMSGSAGLPATLAALELARDVALANKETLVAAGELVVAMARRTGARLLPVDSEHSGVWQILGGVAGDAGPVPAPPMTMPRSVRRVILTASGGPFRGCVPEQIYRATPAQALQHPTWRMGPKVTVDSASLMNKALEIIEAHWLFGLSGSCLDVLIHPQSVVHAMIELVDGSTLAQLSCPDMRGPIQHALTYPYRLASAGPGLAWELPRTLDFEPVDETRYPAIRLARQVLGRGGTAGAVFNAANEAAVEAFLAGAIPFGRIMELVCEAMARVPVGPLCTLDDVLAADAEARRCVRTAVGLSVSTPAS